MSNSDDKTSKPPVLPPLGGKNSGGESGNGEKRSFGQTLQGLGDLKVPRARSATEFNPRPAVTKNDEKQTAPQPGKVPIPSPGESSQGGWQSVPLTELSIPAPRSAGAAGPPRPRREPQALPEFEDEATQIGVGLRSEVHVHPSEIEELDVEFEEIEEIQELDVEPMELELEPLDGDFDAEPTMLSSTEAFMKQDQAAHDERLGFAKTSATPINTPFNLPAASSQEIFSSVPDAAQSGQLRGSEPLPAPIKSATAPAPSSAAPDGGEFNAEKTEMLNSPFEAGPSVARLHALDGPVTGQEFFVTQMRNTIGRGDNNSIMVADAAMSRQHLEIIKNPDDTYTLRDLQSVNGTMLNGTRVRESDLFHGDRIEAGKTVMQFVVQGGVQQPSRNRRLVPAAMGTLSGASPAVVPAAQLPPPGTPPQELTRLSTYITIIAGIISVVLLVGIAFLLLNSGGDKGGSSPELASQHYLSGVEAVKNRDWEAANTEFQKAKELDPQLKIGPQLERIKTEQSALVSFEKLQAAYKKGDWDSVTTLAASIPEESVYHGEAEKLSGTRKKLEVDSIYSDAQSRVTNEDYDGAEKLIAVILAESPNHRGALELRDRIEELQDEARQEEAAEEEEATEKSTSGSKTVAARSNKSDGFELIGAPSSKPKRSSASKDGNSGDALKLYAAKKFDAAAEAFEKMARSESGSAATKARQNAKEVREFESSYKAGKRHYAIKKWSNARTALKKAYRSDSQISGGRGHHRSELGTMLAVTEAQLGLAALDRRDYGQARTQLKEAEAYDSKEDTVRNLRRQIQASAKALYIKAANLRKTNPAEAGRLCRNIMALTPSSDATHQKAKKLLSEI